VALGKDDDCSSRLRRGTFAESLSLPRARLSAKLTFRVLGFAESLAVGKGSLPRVLPALGKGSFAEGLALGKARLWAKLQFPVVSEICIPFTT